MDHTTVTILQAASNILREEGLRRVREASALGDRECANSALLASVTIDQYLAQADNLNRPF